MRVPKSPTRAVTADVVKYLKCGVPLETSLKLVLGSAFDAGFEWLLIATGAHPTAVRATKAHKHFHDEVTRAQAHAEAVRVGVLAKDSKPKWAMAWLQTQARERWRPAANDADTANTLRKLIADVQRRAATPVEDPRRRRPAHLADGTSVAPVLPPAPPVVIDEEWVGGMELVTRGDPRAEPDRPNLRCPVR